MLPQEKLLVTPIDEAKLLVYLKENLPKKEGHTYRTSLGALVGENVLVDNECCYSFLEKKFGIGKPQFVLDCPIMIDTKTDDGQFMGMLTEFYFPIVMDDLKPFLLPEVSLKEFMGRRYNYNPRITKNMKEFLKDVGQQVFEQENS